MIDIDALASAICEIAEQTGVSRFSVVEVLMEAQLLSSAQYSAIIEYLN